MSKMRQMRRALRDSVGKVVGYQIRDGYGASIAPVLERVIRGERIHDAEVMDALASDDIDSDQRDGVASCLRWVPDRTQ